MYAFKCKMCGAALNIEQHKSITECQYCGVSQTLPRLDDEVIANLYDRANHFRRNNEFDKAEAIYEQILDKDTSDSEAYWSLVLCRYGIEYVEDSASHKRIPTINRMQYTSIYDDDNYKMALQYADGEQKPIYEEEAKTINEIQKNILDISNKEEPFDVFISYKESDENGNRTVDSTLGYDIYDALTKEGLKVFFSRITLEDKIGTEYEPYIFAALNSARVMVVLGTKREYFNSVWMKNEWSRYLAIIKESRGNKTLIPIYKDMDPYDMPEEFSHLQALDIAKIGALQDLIIGVKKLVKDNEAKKNSGKKGESLNVENILNRAGDFLENGEWDKAIQYYNRILDYDMSEVRAYLGLLLAKRQCREIRDLQDGSSSLTQELEYNKVLQLSKDEDLKAELEEINNYLVINTTYLQAIRCMENTTTEYNGYREALKLFENISGFKDAEAKAEECKRMASKASSYSQGCGLLFLSKMEDSSERRIALKSYDVKKSSKMAILKKAVEKFSQAKGYKDADQKKAECEVGLRSMKGSVIFRFIGLATGLLTSPLAFIVGHALWSFLHTNYVCDLPYEWLDDWYPLLFVFLPLITVGLNGISIIVNIVQLIKFFIYNSTDKDDEAGLIAFLSLRMILLFILNIIFAIESASIFHFVCAPPIQNFFML